MKAWLFAIMRNLFWDRFKGSRKEDVSLDDVGEFILYEKLRDEGARPEADVLDKLAATEVVKAVEQLPPLHREVVLLVDVEGFSYKDAAQALGVPIGTVMSRLHRARQQLQKSLYDYAAESGIVRGVDAGCDLRRLSLTPRGERDAQRIRLGGVHCHVGPPGSCPLGALHATALGPRDGHHRFGILDLHADRHPVRGARLVGAAP